MIAIIPIDAHAAGQLERTRLRDAGHDVVGFDHRGMGRTPLTGAPYSIADLATDVEGLVHLAREIEADLVVVGDAIIPRVTDAGRLGCRYLGFYFSGGRNR